MTTELNINLKYNEVGITFPSGKSLLGDLNTDYESILQSVSDLLVEKQLKIEVTLSGYNDNKELFKHFITLISNSSSVFKINLGYNAFDADSQMIAAELAKSHSIQAVDMSSNGLSKDGRGIAVAEELATSRSINEVNLSNNWLKDAGPAIAQKLAASIHIHTIDMSSNRLQEHGLAVAEALSGSTHIHVIHLEQNEFTASQKESILGCFHDTSSHSSDSGYHQADADHSRLDDLTGLPSGLDNIEVYL